MLPDSIRVGRGWFHAHLCAIFLDFDMTACWGSWRYMPMHERWVLSQLSGYFTSLLPSYIGEDWTQLCLHLWGCGGRMECWCRLDSHDSPRPVWFWAHGFCVNNKCCQSVSYCRTQYTVSQIIFIEMVKLSRKKKARPECNGFIGIKREVANWKQVWGGQKNSFQVEMSWSG